jgi:D-alanine transfer protein
LRKEVHPRFYDGNFSELQARELLFSPRLSLALKREVAASMLQLPAPLEKRPALRFLLERVARATAWDRAVFLAAAPLGWLENLVAFAQDHWEAVQLIRESSKQKRRSPQARKLDWPALFAEARAHTYVGSDDWKQPEKAFAEIEERGEPAFLDAVAHAQEWERLELLLRTVDELGGRPLLISPPLNGPYLDRLHVTPKARSIFYGRLEEMAARHRMMLVDFRDQENDPKFLADHHDHPSPLGWMWYNRVIDAYYHGGDLGFAREGTGAAR